MVPVFNIVQRNALKTVRSSLLIQCVAENVGTPGTPIPTKLFFGILYCMKNGHMDDLSVAPDDVTLNMSWPFFLLFQ